jgi:hypothetical protein
MRRILRSIGGFENSTLTRKKNKKMKKNEKKTAGSRPKGVDT